MSFPDDGQRHGEDLRSAYRNVASHVGRLARGARPADLSVAQPAKFELVINLGTAKAFGFAIPQSPPMCVDGVIE